MSHGGDQGRGRAGEDTGSREGGRGIWERPSPPSSPPSIHKAKPTETHKTERALGPACDTTRYNNTQPKCATCATSWQVLPVAPAQHRAKGNRTGGSAPTSGANQEARGDKQLCIYEFGRQEKVRGTPKKRLTKNKRLFSNDLCFLIFFLNSTRASRMHIFPTKRWNLYKFREISVGDSCTVSHQSPLGALRETLGSSRAATFHPTDLRAATTKTSSWRPHHTQNTQTRRNKTIGPWERAGRLGTSCNGC